MKFLPNSSTVRYSLVALCLVVITIHLYTIHLPGFGYDELMWVGVALDEPAAPFTARKWGEHYIYLMTYIGALKGYIYRVIFTFVDPSFLSVRLPLIIGAIGGTLLLKLPESESWNENTAWLGVFFLILCPTVTYFAHLDNGPSTLEYIARCALICLAMKAISKTHLSIPIMLSTTLIVVLAFWNKASFIAFSVGLGAFYVAYAVIFASIARRWITGIFGLFVMSLSFLLYFQLLSKLDIQSVSGTGFYPSRISEIMHNIFGYDYLKSMAWISGTPTTKISFLVAASAAFSALLVTVCFIAGWLKRVWGQTRSLCTAPKVKQEAELARNHITSALILLFFVTSSSATCFVLLSTLADKPWHSYLTFPSLPLLIITCLLWAKNTHTEKMPIIGKSVNILSLALLGAIFLTASNARIFYTLTWPAPASNPTTSWARLLNTRATTDFFEDSRHYEGKIFLGDWGLETQVIAYGVNKEKNAEQVWEYRFNDPKYNNHYFKQLELELETGIAVFHGEDATAIKGVKPKVLDYFTSVNREINLCKSYKDPDGVVIVEVWTYDCTKFLGAVSKSN